MIPDGTPILDRQVGLPTQAEWDWLDSGYSQFTTVPAEITARARRVCGVRRRLVSQNVPVNEEGQVRLRLHLASQGLGHDNN